MCELFAVTAAKPISLNAYLKEFYSHSVDHQNGWGQALFDEGNIAIEKEPVRAKSSTYLKRRLSVPVESSRMIAHIRRATIGDVDYHNCHPFTKMDASGRNWVLMHNGTVFDTAMILSHKYPVKGTTDSEWILYRLLHHMNEAIREKNGRLTRKERIEVVDRLIHELAPGNKLNLVIYDGEVFYIHKNQEGTLHQKKLDQGMIFSTEPLDSEGWSDVPQNQLQVYRDGKRVAVGEKHSYSYIYEEEHYRLLYAEYASL